MMLDIIDNLPRLRMSSNLFRMVLWVLKETGLSNVPSYEAFRKLQTDLRKRCGSEPTKYKSSLGNIFYMNSIEETTARVCYRVSSCSLLNPPLPGLRKSKYCTSHALLPRGNYWPNF